MWKRAIDSRNHQKVLINKIIVSHESWQKILFFFMKYCSVFLLDAIKNQIIIAE